MPLFLLFLSIIYESEVDHMVNLPDIKKIVTNLPGCAVPSGVKSCFKAGYPQLDRYTYHLQFSSTRTAV